MSLNKALQMDSHASSVPSITEYSATPGSSSFSSGHWPGMGLAGLLLSFKQGTQSLEDYIEDYLVLTNGSDLPDSLLVDLFCDGINQPL